MYEKSNALYKFCYHCAPVILGIKPSNTMVLAEKELELIKECLKNTEIDLYTLGNSGEKKFVMAYRDSLLKQRLNDFEVVPYMEKMGYSEKTVIGKLERLKARYEYYCCNKRDFPHEIGVFLNYPIQDIIDYQQKGTRQCILSGYWQVFSNKEKAERIFQQYDCARNILIGSLKNGFTFSEIYHMVQGKSLTKSE